MRKLIFIVLFITSIHSYAQNQDQFGLTFFTGNNDFFSSKELIGAPGYTGDGFYSIGISYLKPIKDRLSFETGLEYSRYKIVITPNVSPGSNKIPKNEKIGLFTVPITYRFNFLHYLFINAGVLLDIDNRISGSLDNQTGIGALIGIGLKYDFKSGISFMVNPCARLHSIFQFSSNGNLEHLSDSGIKLGVSYHF